MTISGCQAISCSSDAVAMLPRPPMPSTTVVAPTRSMISVLIEPRAPVSSP